MSQSESLSESAGRASPSLATFDAGEFLHRCMNRLDFAEKILGCFQQQSAIYLQQIQDAVGQGQAQQAHRPAHTLKGASANLAAKKLADLAGQAEQAAMQQQLQAVERLIQPMKEELDRLLKQAPASLAACAEPNP